MIDKKEFSIIEIVSDPDISGYLKRRAEMFERLDLGNIAHTIQQGVTVVPMQSQQGMGFLNVPWTMIEYICTEDQYKSWKFQQKIKT